MRLGSIRSLLILALLAGAGLPAPAMADGFGWYAYLVDFPRLEAGLSGELGAAFASARSQSSMPELQGSGFVLLGLLEESDQALLSLPRAYDQELLGAEAFEAFGTELTKRDPGSPARFLLTGRQFLGLDAMPACLEAVWVHGACGSAIFFTPREVVALFREVNELEAAQLRWPQSWMHADLLRLRDILQEAALLKRALFLYGHD